MHNESIECVAAGSVAEVMQQADCVITATVPVKPIITRDDLRPGMHLCAIGGDGPYKRELTPACLQDAKVIIEYWPQTEHEGEVKGCTRDVVHAELWEVVQSLKPGRESNDEITVFDSVGVAIEDHVVLQHVYECAQRLGLGQQVDFIPSLDDPKDLYRACFSR
jgi:ornithine cyclodeaminase